MSDVGDILTALTTDVESAVSGVTVGIDPINLDDLLTADLPYCLLLAEPAAAEHVDWGQEQRTWPVHGWLVQKGGTREAMQLLLEAIRDAVFADPTLDGAVYRALCMPLTTYSSGDSERIVGEFSVMAEKTV